MCTVYEGKGRLKSWTLCGRLSTVYDVLAALATGGLGVSGLEPACGLPYPTLGPPVRGGAVDGPLLFTRVGSCTDYEGDPYATIGRQSLEPPAEGKAK